VATTRAAAEGGRRRRLAARLAFGLAAWTAAAFAADLERIDLDVRPDFEAGRIEIGARLEIDNPSYRADFEFGLSDRYDRVRVTAAGAECAVEREPGGVVVRVDRPGARVELEFELSGPAGASDDERRPVLSPDDLFLLWSDRFYPIDFEDWAVAGVTLTLPAGFEAIAPGRLVARDPVPGGERWRFETSQPVRNLSVFADRRWVRRVHQIGPRRIETLLHPESDALAAKIARSSADVLDFFEGLHGGYPFDGFAFVTLDGIYARRAFPGFVGYSPAYLAKEMERTGHDAHETSLLWWGYAFGGRGPGSFQWLEGLGDYVEILYDEARGFPVPAIFERFRGEYLAATRDEEPAIDALRGSTPQKFVHGKYPWLMHVLRGEVGDDAFRAGVRRVYAACRFRACTLEELVDALEAGSGRSLARWRTQWLERRGVPELELEVRREAGALRVQLRQTGELYDLPLEIALDGPAGRRVERIDLPARPEVEIGFALDGGVDDVVLDPARRLLLRVRPAAPE